MFRINRRSRLVPTIVAALGVAAMIPAGAAAGTTTFGSSLNHAPANAGSTCADNGVEVPACTHVGSYFPGFSGRAQAPSNGTVVAFKVRAQAPTKLTFRLVKVRNVTANHKAGDAKAMVKGPTVNVHGPTEDQANDGIYPVERFSVHLKVKKGWEVAVDTKRNTAEYCADGTPGQLLFAPVLGLGQNFRSSAGVDGCIMLIQAVEKR